MNDTSIQKAKELIDKIEKDDFFYGNNKYYILKLNNKSTICRIPTSKDYNGHAVGSIFDKKNEIYSYDECHIDFLQMLPSITVNFPNLEKVLKDYCEYAQSSNFNLHEASTYLANAIHSLYSLHPFFKHNDSAFIYLRSNLYNYLRKTAGYRFLLYLRNPLVVLPDFSMSKDDTPNSSNYKNSIEPFMSDFCTYFNKFLELEENYIKNIFLPLYGLTDVPNRILDHSTISKVENNRKVSELWRHYNADTFKDTQPYFQIYLYFDIKTDTEKKYLSTYILPKLKIISDVFTDYFSIFSDLLEAYPKVTILQQYALLLTNNYSLMNMVNSCQVSSTHTSMYRLINGTMVHSYKSLNSGTQILSLDHLPDTLANSIYDRIKDSFDYPDKKKKSIYEDLKNFYSPKMQSYVGAEIIDFKYFEQAIAIELLDIIAANTAIKKCVCPECNTYFITTSKKRKYCDSHKNKANIYQLSYHTKKISFQSDFESIVNKYLSCFQKRVKRKRLPPKDFDNWKLDSKNLIENYSTKRHPSIDDFVSELNILCKKYNIAPPREYHKS